MRSLVVAVVDGQNSHEFCYAECTNLTGAGSMLGSMGYMSPVLPENQHMLRNIFSRPSLAMFLVVYSLATRSVADEPLPAAEVKRQRQRMLTGDDAKRAAELQQRIAAAEQADKYDEVIALDEKLLALRTARQGADHWETVDQKGALAAAAKAAARPAGERAKLRNAVQSHREALRLHEMGRYAEAQPLFQKALDLSRKLLGENDRDTARGYCNVALGLSHQGEYAEAQPLLVQAAASYEAARLNIASRGLERASYGANGSPYRLLVATLARLNHLAEAWAAAESDLSRGSSDEVASRRGASVITEERDQRAATVAELSKIQSLILQLVSATPPTDEQKRELTALQVDRRRLESKLSELAVAISHREIAKRDQVQAAIPEDAALVLWVDPGSVREAWGCVLRSIIDPQWQPLPGEKPNECSCRWPAEENGPNCPAARSKSRGWPRSPAANGARF